MDTNQGSLRQVLKGSVTGLTLLECQNFEYNVKEVRNAYETNLLKSGELDERMYLSNDPVLATSASPVSTAPVTPMPHIPRRGLVLVGGACLLI